jgi:hypothetical protein
LFPVASVAVQFRYVIPLQLRLLESEHTAEATVSAQKAAKSVDFKIS